MKFYPKAREQRPSIHHPSVRPRRLGVLKAATVNLLLLQILFLGLFCYIFGALFQQSGHIHNINVLFVDYDGGAIGDAARVAFQKLKGPGFPTFVERSVSMYPQPGLIEGAVCDIKYWAALYTTANASNALSAAFAGGSAASSYNQTDVLTLVWNEVRYPTVVDSAVADSIKLLSETARVAYSQANGKAALQSVNSSDPAALAAFYEPWTLASNNIQPTSQGSRAIYNTLVIILILIQEFFYLGTINGLYAQFKLYTSVTPHRMIIARQIISLIYTLFGGMCTAGAIWAFRSGWNVNGNQFCAHLAGIMALCTFELPRAGRLHHLASASLRTDGTDIVGRLECHFHSSPIRALTRFLQSGLRLTGTCCLPGPHRHLVFWLQPPAILRATCSLRLRRSWYHPELHRCLSKGSLRKYQRRDGRKGIQSEGGGRTPRATRGSTGQTGNDA